MEKGQLGRESETFNALFPLNMNVGFVRVRKKSVFLDKRNGELLGSN